MSETKTETYDTTAGDALRGEVRTILAAEGKSQVDLARESVSQVSCGREGQLASGASPERQRGRNLTGVTTVPVDRDV